MGINEPNSVGDMGTSSSGSTISLSLELFKEIFKNIEPEVEIDNFESEQGSGRGDNYTATLYRTRLSGHRISTAADGKKQKWEKIVICKRLPENVARREAYKSDKLFRNEVEFYTSIMPELLRFQATKSSQVFKAIPKYYYARPDLLIMEDLRLRGFEMADRQMGLTIAETRLVLKQVAQFHGLSLSYKFEKPKQFEKIRKLATEGLFAASNADWYKNYYDRLLTDAITMVSDVLPEDSKYLEVMKKFADSNTFFTRMVQLAGAETRLSGICHGDCWINNFLYIYEVTEEGRNPLEVCLVDFQLIRYGSIALDVANLLFCCTSKAMRDEHLTSFMKLYSDEVFHWLKTLCTKLPTFCDTAEKFSKVLDEEMKTYGKFALGLAMDILPISTCSTEDAPDMYMSVRHDDIEEGAPVLNFPPNDLCRQRMSEMVIDLVDRGML